MVLKIKCHNLTNKFIHNIQINIHISVSTREIAELDRDEFESYKNIPQVLPVEENEPLKWWRDK